MFVQLGGMVSLTVKVRQSINIIGEQFLLSIKIPSECKCYTHGSVGIGCTDDGGVCTCNAGYTGTKCNQCQTGWFMVNGICNGKFPLFMYLYLLINKMKKQNHYQRVAQLMTLHLEVMIFWSVENTICMIAGRIVRKLA